MTKKTAEETLADASAWWDTAIIDIHPGKIAIRGYPIEELIGNVGFAQMIWLMLRGELPSRAQADLLEAALVPGVDHGPHAPSIAISRMYPFRCIVHMAQKKSGQWALRTAGTFRSCHAPA